MPVDEDIILQINWDLSTFATRSAVRSATNKTSGLGLFKAFPLGKGDHEVVDEVKSERL